jgi:hypothetical protein
MKKNTKTSTIPSRPVELSRVALSTVSGGGETISLNYEKINPRR